MKPGPTRKLASERICLTCAESFRPRRREQFRCSKSCASRNQRKRIPLSERFWAKVDVRGPDECWPWLGAKTRGYGQFGGDQERIAHRVCWTLCFGPIPEGMDVLHSCDNPPCCNPRCLFLGTQDDNVADMVAKGRQARGEASGSAKLDTARVLLIRDADGSCRELAAEFNISTMLVSLVKRKKIWRHVP